MNKHIKITSVTGAISFAAFNNELYNRLNQQNDAVAPSRKSKIEIVDITAEEIAEQTGYDEKAALELNPITAKLAHESEAKDSKIAELEKQLEALKLNTTPEVEKETKTKK